MAKKYFLTFSKLLFWLAPVLFWFFWQIILYRTNYFWMLLGLSVIIILIATYEAMGRKLNKYFLIISFDLVVFVASFYLFSSLIITGWWLQIFWLYFVWHLYSYLISLRNYHLGKVNYFLYFSIYSSLVSFFLFSSLLFGLQSFLSFSPALLLIGVFPLILINMMSIAIIQSWDKLRNFWFWLFLALLSLEFIAVLTLLPLNYLVLGTLSVLFYYSIFNFVRLYLINRLTKTKIKNYIIFIMISLLVIFLTARWL
jgi:hypothetical protein